MTIVKRIDVRTKLQRCQNSKHAFGFLPVYSYTFFDSLNAEIVKIRAIAISINGPTMHMYLRASRFFEDRLLAAITR